MKDSNQIFEELKNDLTSYVELKAELFKLNAYEKTAKVLSVLSYGLILVFLAFFAILFIFLALGFLLSELLHSFGAGFGVVALLYLVLIGIILGFKDRISRTVINEVIAALAAYDEKKNETEYEQQSATDTAGTTESRQGPA